MEIQLASSNQEKLSLWIKKIKFYILNINRLFLITVIIPTIVSIIYFGFIASDIYISESRFVVRGPQQQQSSLNISELLQESGFSKSKEEASSVHDFMLSRDALNKLNSEFSLGEKFKRSSIDIFSRFDLFGLDSSFESLFKYYQKRVSVEEDANSSVSVLRVNTFNKKDSYHINLKLLEMGEDLINQLNERARQDMIRFARAEVEIAEKKVKAAAVALSNYRNNQIVFDPERQSALLLQLTSKIQDEIISSRIQLAQLSEVAPNNPQIIVLKNRILGLQSEMEKQIAKIAGGGKSSLSNKAADYERLILERTFADKQLASAVFTLEQAQNNALRKQLYLERIVQPNEPDSAVEPHRIKAILTTVILGLVIMGVLTILIAGIREHKD